MKIAHTEGSPMSTTGDRVLKDEFDDCYVLTVRMNDQTKYMRVFSKSVNYEDALNQVLNDIQVNHGKQD